MGTEPQQPKKKLSTYRPDSCIEWIPTRTLHPSENGAAQSTPQTKTKLEP